ncbi:hypothetical protein FJZ31_21620 [Candidatus Poribacteria bacterium]|nr:hypothetical protein [Candidatus Poribacteria bacterium]
MIRKMFSTIIEFAFVLMAIIGLSIGIVMAQKEAKGTSYKITEQSLESLKSEGVSDDVLEKLQSVKNQEFIGEQDFLDISLKKRLELNNLFVSD